MAISLFDFVCEIACILLKQLVRVAVYYVLYGFVIIPIEGRVAITLYRYNFWAILGISVVRNLLEPYYEWEVLRQLWIIILVFVFMWSKMFAQIGVLLDYYGEYQSIRTTYQKMTLFQPK